MSRQYPAKPVLAVSGVVLAQGEVLLVKRGTPPLRGAWSLPGGVVELGENIEQALAREIFEETGLLIQMGPLLEVVERIMPDNQGRMEYHYVILNYVCRAEHLPPRPGDDAAEARWTPKVMLPHLGITSETLRIIERALAAFPTTI